MMHRGRKTAAWETPFHCTSSLALSSTTLTLALSCAGVPPCAVLQLVLREELRRRLWHCALASWHCVKQQQQAVHSLYTRRQHVMVLYLAHSCCICGAQLHVQRGLRRRLVAAESADEYCSRGPARIKHNWTGLAEQRHLCCSDGNVGCCHDVAASRCFGGGVQLSASGVSSCLWSLGACRIDGYCFIA
jgi:hypothetical protein